jgi:uncharacterized protein
MNTPIARLVRGHPLVTFFVLAYALAWGFWPLSAAVGFPFPFFPGAPLLAALIVIAVTEGRAGLRRLGGRLVRWRVGWSWYAVALGVPLAVALAAAALNVGLGAPLPAVGQLGPLSGVLLAFAVRLVDPTDGPLGEEPGWRGYAQPGLQARHSVGGATLLLGLLVAGWHLPLVLIPGPQQLAPLALVATVAVTFWYAWLFNHTGGSVLLTLVAHAAEGPALRLAAAGVAGADATRLVGLYAGVWGAVALGLVVFDQRLWRTRPAVTPGAAPAGEPPGLTPPPAPVVADQA